MSKLKRHLCMDLGKEDMTLCERLNRVASVNRRDLKNEALEGLRKHCDAEEARLDIRPNGSAPKK